MEYVKYEISRDIHSNKIYILTIKKVPHIDCQYLLVFNNYDEYKQFEHANKKIIGLGVDIRYGKSKNTEKYLFKIDMKYDGDGFNKGVLIFHSSNWVRENIDNIVKSLNKQADNFSMCALEFKTEYTK